MGLRSFIKSLLQKNKSSASIEMSDTHGHVEIAHNIKKQELQQAIDRLLDKISKHGMDGLSKKEKDFLQQQKR
ncbi:MAG: hypothetical protein LBK47_06455 [Prevotellaceae bacterium]|jgi:hypothetical protein|nr:hypothetical protein [Prevotellaceae bacterium]